MNDKQQRFVAEYLIDLNATQAAIRAGYSAKTAKQIGSRLLTVVDVQAAIEAGKAKQLDKAELSAVRVLEEYRRLALSDVTALFDPETGKFKSMKDMPAEARAAIASVKATKKNLVAGDGVQEDVIEIRLWDKTRALEGLGKHFGLFKETIDVQGGLTLAWQDDE